MFAPNSDLFYVERYSGSVQVNISIHLREWQRNSVKGGKPAAMGSVRCADPLKSGQGLVQGSARQSSWHRESRIRPFDRDPGFQIRVQDWGRARKELS